MVGWLLLSSHDPYSYDCCQLDARAAQVQAAILFSFVWLYYFSSLLLFLSDRMAVIWKAEGR